MSGASKITDPVTAPADVQPFVKAGLACPGCLALQLPLNHPWARNVAAIVADLGPQGDHLFVISNDPLGPWNAANCYWGAPAKSSDHQWAQDMGDNFVHACAVPLEQPGRHQAPPLTAQGKAILVSQPSAKLFPGRLAREAAQCFATRDDRSRRRLAAGARAATSRGQPHGSRAKAGLGALDGSEPTGRLRPDPEQPPTQDHLLPFPTLVYGAFDPGFEIANTREGTPATLRAYASLLPHPDDVQLVEDVLIQVRFATQRAVIVAATRAGDCTWKLVPDDDVQTIRVSDSLLAVRRGRLDWDAWPPTLSGEVIEEVGAVILEETHHGDLLRRTPPRQVQLSMGWQHIERLVRSLEGIVMAIYQDVRVARDAEAGTLSRRRVDAGCVVEVEAALRVLLAAATVGPSAAEIAQAISWPPSDLSPIVERLERSGVFRDNSVFATWYTAGLPAANDLVLDALVGSGDLVRDPDGLTYRLPTGSAHWPLPGSRSAKIH